MLPEYNQPLFFVSTTPHGLWDLSFSTRDQTVLTAMKAQVLTTGPPRNSPSIPPLLLFLETFLPSCFCQATHLSIILGESAWIPLLTGSPLWFLPHFLPNAPPGPCICLHHSSVMDLLSYLFCVSSCLFSWEFEAQTPSVQLLQEGLQGE